MSSPIGLIDQSIVLERAGGAPLFAQIAAALGQRIAAGAIGRGMRLPPERDLAQTLGVNRATVGRAYRELEARGLVASRVGSGTVVLAGPDPAPDTPAAALPRPASAPPAPLSRGIRELAASAGGPTAAAPEGAIDFALMLPDVDMFPTRKLAEAARAALARGAEVLQYGSPSGLPSLRRALAQRLNQRGIEVSADEVLVVNGIQQALDLLAKTLLDPGDAVVVEAPTYANVLPLLRLYGADIIGVAMDGEGMRADLLERTLAERRPKFVYTIPSFHNPTGITMSRARRTAVLAACRNHGTLVVEDGYEEELRYHGEPLPPLAALAGGEGVAYLGTFSKGLFPGLRLGYIAGRGELFAMLTLAKRYSDYHANLLAQALLAELLERGDYDRHLVRLRSTYGERLKQTLAAIEKHFPAEVRVRAPEGGYTAWAELPPGLKASAITEEARRQGVLVVAGRPFYDRGAGDGEGGIRLSISRTAPERIEEGIAILGRVLHKALARMGPMESNPEAPSLV